VPNCAEAGVLGALCGQVGSLMATEAIKLIAGIGTPLIGRILVIDALSGRFSEVPLVGTGVAAADPRPTPVDVAPAPDWPRLTAAELAVRLAARASGGDSFLVVDVREPDEHAESAVPGAVLLPLGRLLTEEGLASLPSNVPLVLHCHQGSRAQTAATALHLAGFTKLSLLSGGIVAWDTAVAAGAAPGSGSKWTAGEPLAARS
jgi:rhodanese-related sulfurtransferase